MLEDVSDFSVQIDSDFNTKNVKFVVARKLLLLGNEASFQRGCKADVERALGTPVVAIEVRLFSPGINAMPYGIPERMSNDTPAHQSKQKKPRSHRPFPMFLPSKE